LETLVKLRRRSRAPTIQSALGPGVVVLVTASSGATLGMAPPGP
jgi:hypothetical protein